MTTGFPGPKSSRDSRKTGPRPVIYLGAKAATTMTVTKMSQIRLMKEKKKNRSFARFARAFSTFCTYRGCSRPFHDVITFGNKFSIDSSNCCNQLNPKIVSAHFARHHALVLHLLLKQFTDLDCLFVSSTFFLPFL